jgi:hypothetical protein
MRHAAAIAIATAIAIGLAIGYLALLGRMTGPAPTVPPGETELAGRASTAAPEARASEQPPPAGEAIHSTPGPQPSTSASPSTEPTTSGRPNGRSEPLPNAPPGSARVERLILDYFARRPDEAPTSIGSVHCDETRCEVAFTGTDVNPGDVSRYGSVQQNLRRDLDKDHVQVLSSSLGTREIAPGAREYVLGFSFAVTAQLSADRVAAARQHASCASAWRARAALADGQAFQETAREARDRAEIELALAAAVLGGDEAKRLASAPDRGPLIDQCVAARMFIDH